MFDTYWNHRAALPMQALTRGPDNPEEALDELRTRLAESLADVSESRYAAVVRSIILDAVQRDVSTTCTWAPYDLVFDSPDKWRPTSDETADSITT